ncbi:hypothetical protein H0W32_00285 [Patescibacteria group bacterium]|nr:hypothetical protein [Patescibacteria group bacterium]
MNYTNEQLDTVFESLPPELQEYIMSDEVKSNIQNVINEYVITDDTTFRKIVFTLLLGITTLDEFMTYTTTIPHTAPEQHELIIDEITSSVLNGAWALSKQLSPETPTQPQSVPVGESAAEVDVPNIEHPLPAITTSQTPITALLDDPHDGESIPQTQLQSEQHHEGPVPLSKTIPAKDPYGGHDPYREDPVYELK